jgi:hypothetical protein
VNRVLRSESEATCSVKHRHASDIRRSTQGALAPVQVMLSWSIITYSTPSAPLAGTSRFRRIALIRTFAVRERLGDPRLVPGFRCTFRPDMPSSTDPGRDRGTARATLGEGLAVAG